MDNNLIVCGGTFDHFHKGHEAFLDYAFSLSKQVIIGVTSDIYIHNSKSKIKNSELIENFEKRQKSVLEFAKKREVLQNVKVVRIDDLFGPTLERDLLIDGIVVSSDTEKGAETINRKRKDLGLNILKIYIAPSVNAEDGNIISSQRIRSGEINRFGRLYVNPSWLKTDLILLEDLRQEFKKPLGAICQDIDLRGGLHPFLVITVGDETSKKFNEKSVGQNISVVDFKIARKEEFSSFFELGFLGNEEVIEVNNPPGHITKELFLALSRIIYSVFKNRVIVRILGEDDLSVVPLILLCPLNTVIYYGQPNEGLIKVIVDEETKNKTYNLASKLKPI